MKLKKLLLVLFCLLFCVSVASSQGTYYLTDEQLNNLIKQIDNLQSNNKSMILLLEKQKTELATLEKNYETSYLTMTKQQQNYEQLLSKSKDRELIYKYGIVASFVVGLIAGIVIAK